VKTLPLLKLLDLLAESKEEAKELKEILTILSLTGEEVPELIEALEIKAKELLLQDLNFPPPRADMLGSEGLIIGIEENTGLPFFWEEPKKSCLIMGSIGSGKTNLALNLIHQLVEKGVTVWIFDRRKDYWPLIRSLEGTHLIPWRELRFNVLFPPEGVGHEVWLGKVAEAFCHTYDLLTGSKSLFEEVLFIVWQEADREGRIPTFVDVYERFSRKDYVPVRTALDPQYRSRILDRLRPILRKAGSILACERGFDLISLSECGRAVIFDVSLEEQFRDFLILTLMWHIWCYRNENAGTYSPLVFVLDEARYTLRERRGSLEHYILDIDQLITGSRPFNMGFIICEQVPSQLSRAIVDNTQLKVAFNTQAHEIPHVARIMGLSREQADVLRSLEVGECIAVLAGSRCSIPVLLRIPLYSGCGDRIPREEAENAIRETIEELGWDWDEQEEEFRQGLPEEEFELLKEVAKDPFRSLSEYITALKTTKRRFYTTLSRLIEKKLLKTSKVNPGKGRPRKLLELTERGIHVLRREIPDAEIKPLHGGVAHAFWIEELKRSLSPRHKVEVCKALHSGRIPDLLVDGTLAIEVEASANVRYDLEKYKEILKEIPHLLIAVEEANCEGLLEELEKALKKGLTPEERSRVKILKVQELLKEFG